VDHDLGLCPGYKYGGKIEMMDKVVSLARQGAIVAVIGGIMAYILAFIVGPIMGMAFGGTIAAFIAILLALYLAAATDVEALDIFSLVVLLGMVGVVGGLIVGFLPAASPFILTFDAAFTVQGLLWTFVYIGLAFLVEKHLFPAD
jgi:hypothetical protein